MTRSLQSCNPTQQQRGIEDASYLFGDDKYYGVSVVVQRASLSSKEFCVVVEFLSEMVSEPLTAVSASESFRVWRSNRVIAWRDIRKWVKEAIEICRGRRNVKLVVWGGTVHERNWICRRTRVDFKVKISTRRAILFRQYCNGCVYWPSDGDDEIWIILGKPNK